MRRYLLLAFIPLAALVGCQREPSPEDLQMQEVKTQFVFNISGHRTPSTKQSARATQADGNFRGIDRGKLFAYVLPQDGQPEFHQFIIIRLVPGGSAKLGNAGGFGKGDPDFRHQHAFQIQTDNVHPCFLHTSHQVQPSRQGPGAFPPA